MAKFVYRMQGILNIKLKLEDQAKTAYSFAAKKVADEEERLVRLKEKKEYYINQKRNEMATTINVKELELVENAIHTTDIQIGEQIVVINQAKKSLEIARIKLDEAIKERKIQEKLRENAFEEFKREVEAEEQKEINELVSFRFGNGKVRQEE
ncbi:MAG: flagellar export protein FliJ [Lachnospiraceae bacterium]|nr:flagellar export protein FliJ [Lachnospiraceae bacterium]